jgi:4-alpha-glucanotransferase
MTAAALQRLAETMGILPRWQDLSGREHVTAAETQRALLAAMNVPAATETEAEESLSAVQAQNVKRRVPREVIGDSGEGVRIPIDAPADWRLELEQGDMLEGRAKEQISLTPPVGLHRLWVGDHDCHVIVAPARAPGVGDILGRDRAWGFAGALYGLRSDRNLGVGDYRDLAQAGAQLARHGADFIGINPIHARGVASTGNSPYSPSCRTAFEPGHIAVDAVPGIESCTEAQACLRDNAGDLEQGRADDLVDYAGRDKIQTRVLKAVFDSFEGSRDPAAVEFTAWRRGRGAALEWFAVFEAISLVHGPDWRQWPASLQALNGPAVQGFAAKYASQVAYHAWLQWLADRQIGAAQAAVKNAGMGLGLYLDIAVGVRSGGADIWAAPTCYAEGVSLGAPPDDFDPNGQNWSLAPFNPTALRDEAYRPFTRMLRTAMAHSGVIRIDHILGINRSYWVPESGAPGGYVGYPMESLLALIRIEADRAGCIVVGEDLGSVPAGFRERLSASGILGCAVTQFERENGRFRSPATYRSGTLASFGTHDTPTLRGWWSGWDIDIRHGIAQAPVEAYNTARRQRAVERADLARLLTEEGSAPVGFDPDNPPPQADDTLVVALHALLAGAGSELIAVQLDDVTGAVEQQNLPGTVDEYPNWRRRYPVTVDALAADPRLADTAAVFNPASPGEPADKDQQRCL